MGRTPETRYLQHFTSVARAGFRIRQEVKRAMDTITFTDKAPTFHVRLLRALLANKAASKRAAEARATGREKGWNN